MSDSLDAITAAIAALRAGERRTRPVSVTIPEPLISVVQQLVHDGDVTSASAAVTDALTTWLYNRALRLQLDAVYVEHPDLRPTEEEILETMAELGARAADDPVA